MVQGTPWNGWDSSGLRGDLSRGLTCPSRRMFLSSGRCSAVRSRSDLMPRRWQMAIRYRSSSCRDQG